MGRTQEGIPSNVLHESPICHNTGHSAAYPEWLPEFFIKLFTDEGDVVLDPFLGSGTTYRVAERLHRIPVGIEIDETASIQIDGIAVFQKHEAKRLELVNGHLDFRF